MDFSLTAEQSMLQDSVLKFVRDCYSLAQRRQLLEMEQGFSNANWQLFCELGWLALPFAESDDGLGGTPTEIMLLMEQFGRGLVVEPYLATILLAGGLLARAGDGAQKTRYLRPLIAGHQQAAFAYAEPEGRFNLANLATTASRNDAGWSLSGSKAVVLNGPAAHFLIVSARTSGAQMDSDGVSLFLVERGAAGLNMRDYPTLDGFRGAEVSLENVQVGADALLGKAGAALPIIEEVIDNAIVAVGSEAVGCMEMLYKDTVEYCKTRVQFGRPIGQFQVLQHRMVDMFMAYEQTKSLMMMTAIQLHQGYDRRVRKAISAFKVQVGKAGRFIGQNAIQLHGGMGMTDEMSVGHHVKRLTVIEILFGDTDYHLRRFGSL